MSPRLLLIALLLIGWAALARPTPAHAAPVREDDIGSLCDNDNLPKFRETEHFMLNYDKLGPGLTIDMYAEALEQAYRIEVEEYGWAAPPLCAEDDNDCALANPWGKYPIQIVDLSEGEDGLDGYVMLGGDYAGIVNDNPNTRARETEAAASCMVLTNYRVEPDDYTRKEGVYSTAAHEFQHMIQYGYIGNGENKNGDQVIIDMWWESIATYFEEDITDDVNWGYNLLWPDATACFADYDNLADKYGNWIFFDYVGENYGGMHKAGGAEDILQKFWENAVRNDDPMDAFDDALQTYDTSLPDVFQKFAVTLGFSKGCDGDYDSPYCFEEGNAYLDAVGDTIDVQGTIKGTNGEYRGRIREGYAINYVELPKGKAYDVTLYNSARAGTIRANLVCDTGTALAVSPFLDETVPHGSTSVFQNYNTRDCKRVLAVITSDASGTACTERAYRVTLSAATTSSATIPTATPKTKPPVTKTPITKTPSTSRVPSNRDESTTSPATSTDASTDADAETLSCIPALSMFLLMGGVAVTGARKRRSVKQ